MEESKNRKLKRLGAAAAAAAVLASGVAIWMAIPPAITAREPDFGASVDPALIERGKYIAYLGDCVACHTEKGGAPMAGGLALETPMGTIWSTNITPDPKTGIGGWTFGEFDRAMRKGVAANGHNLYPAMPYPSYAKITEEDMTALWAYLIKGLEPVEKPNQPAQMNFPFNLRFGLAYWNAVFADDTPFVPDPAQDEEWNRGAYLVQGLGHCGACHTPRGIGFNELAMTEKGRNGDQFLAGAQVENWHAIELRDLWTVEDTVELLKTGQNRFATVSGSMTDVILHSTQHFTDEDLTAIAVYLKSLPSKHPRPLPPEPVYTGAPDAAFNTAGGLGYMQFCNDCHRPDGTGVRGIFPALAGNPTITAKDPSSLIHITLTGWETAATNAYPRTYTMPAFARLTDKEIAEILSYVRENWGGGAPAVTEAQVAKARKNIDPKIDASTFVTPRLASLLDEPDKDQLVLGMRLNSETNKLLPGHVGNDLNCTSCHLNAGTVADGSPYVGVSAFFPSYAPRSGREITMADRINGCFRRSMNGQPLKPDSEEMLAMLAYFDWMKGETRPEDKVEGRGIGKIDPSLTPDPVNGEKIYAAQCAVCHGANGEGLKDGAGRVVYPALWGERSFNIGAGMARTYTAAAFVKRNMPIGFHEKFPLGQGGLSDQEALDVAEFFSHKPRPDFPGKEKDWPNGGKPKDARY
ncbi:Alcohol dehydrogenase cytochrome c subunit precursor [Pannonibacter phragmitetus]|uniref:Alcohol dehydrogenase cytochrome c subunit n=1 Tax=Pannonibacter phragmitetus TaxID=121719 RepID=A0A378ZTR1_9HYPH|nr:c-type cytochrome [Pannonibacter phragmitetus]SUB00642.1 Alcohol dehydrogenase cytochrome c subunit precursor [Pannonibacter phragmitetus]